MNLDMALQYAASGKPDQAEALLHQLLEKEPENADANFRLGKLYYDIHDLPRAMQLMINTIAFDPLHFEAHTTLAQIQFATSQFDQAITMLEKGRAIDPDDYNRLFTVADIYHKQGYHEQAEANYMQAVTTDPDRFEAYSNLGVLHSNLGDFELAADYFRKAIARNQLCVAAHNALAFLQKQEADSPDAEAMKAAFENSAINDIQKSRLAYGMGKYYEDQGDYAAAFNYISFANQGMKTRNPYSVEEQRKTFQLIKHTFSEDFVSNFGHSTVDEEGPIFIVGMPRSGTTLVEQILASHPDVYGAGELLTMRRVVFNVEQAVKEHYPSQFRSLAQANLDDLASRYLQSSRQHANGARYITDKMPHNFLYIGFIKQLLPNARIIHCQRNPVDTCLSIYKHFLDGDHAYSHNLAELGDYYRHYQDLMRHWHEVLPYQIYDISNEELIENTEEEIRALLNFCRLPFDRACLDFHKTKRKVATASSTQVRSPISSRSVNAWRKYEGHLQPLIKSLRGLS